MPGYFDLWTVFFSFVIASLAGFVAFESIEHTRYSTQPARWRLISGVTLGLGIWSMHFVGMRAWKPPFPLYYSVARTGLSMLVAILASWLAMRLTVHSRRLTRRDLLTGALLVGCGICAMHYVGMSALQFDRPAYWNRTWVAISFLIAVGASYAAMFLFSYPGQEDGMSIGQQTSASLAFGAAVCGMHYTAMHAMMFAPGTVCLNLPFSSSGTALERVGVGNALLLTVCLLIVFYRDKVLLLRSASEARIQAQQATRDAERLSAAGKIAASIAHEINNPLEAVTNLLYLVEHGEVGPREREYLASAQAELHRIAEITTHTLKFYRQQSAATEVRMPDLFASALAVFANRLRSSHVQVETDWDAAAPPILCREGEIRQVFANLVSNAIDAMPTGGVLRLSTRPWSDGVEVTVEDTGTGISPEAQKRILEPFFSTKGLAGTGLGLSICSEIVERHGGMLRFRSSMEPGNSGTTFIVDLPRNAAPGESSPRSSSPSVQGAESIVPASSAKG